MALKGKIYSIARQHDDLNTNELFQSMIDKSAAQDTIVMDGRNIAAGSIFAEQIHAGAITADKIRADAITADHMDVGSLSAISTNIGEITTGIIRSRDSGIHINLNTGIIDLSKPLTINSKPVATSEQVTQAVDGVDGKVDALSTRMSNVEVKIEPSAIVTTVTGHTTFKDVKEKAEAAKSTLDSKSSTWDAKATTGYVDNKASDAESNAKSHANKVVDELEVGGRNYTRNGNFATGDFSNWSRNGSVSIVRVDGLNTVRLTGTNNGFYAYLSDRTFTDVFTISFKAKSVGSSSQIRFGFLNSGTNWTTTNINDSWSTYEFTTNRVSSNSLYHFYATGSTGSGVYITDIQVQRGSKATGYTPAPEDIQLESDKKTYLPVRYIRDWQNGSTSNNGNHWYQIEAYVNGENVARGKPVTGASLSNGTRVTDGVRGGSYASGPRGSLSHVMVDLGKIYYNADSVGVWHYHNDGRTYKETMTEVSPDGTNWYPIFDSAVEGEYETTSAGKIFPNTWARYEAVKTPIRLTERVSSAEQKITDSAIVSTVRQSSSYKNDLTGKVGTNEIISRINQTAESISIDASKINLNGAVTFSSFGSGLKSDFDAKATKSEAQGYASDAIEELEIGSRNILLNSDELVFNGSDQSNNNLTKKVGDHFSITPKYNGNVYNSGGFKTSTDRVEGDLYTFSIEVNTTRQIRMYYRPSERYDSLSIPSTGGKWVKFVHSYKQSGSTKSAGSGFLVGFHGLVAGNTIKYRNPKIEKGNKATEWLPAPEDVNKDIETAEKNAKEYAGKTFRAYGISYSRRNEADVPFSSGQILDDNGDRLTTGNDRSYLLVVVDRNDKVVHSDTYDLYSGTNGNSENIRLRDKLKSYDRRHLIILVGSHAPVERRLDNGLPDVIYNLGGSPEVFEKEQWSGGHPAYLLVGRPDIGEGNGFEVFSSYADGGMVDVLIPIKNGTTTLISGGNTTRKLANTAKGTADSVNKTVSDNSGVWGRASNINSNGTFSTSKLSGKVTDGQISSAISWNDKPTKTEAQKYASDAEGRAKNHADLNDSVVKMTGTGKKFNNPASMDPRTSSISGYLIIRTPITSSYMTRLKISGYNYLNNRANIDLDISFYAYTTGILNRSYINNGDFQINKVQVGRDSAGRAVVIIGTASTNWKYPRIQVDEASLGYSTPPDSYRNGWSMSISTSLSGITGITNIPGVDTQSDLNSAKSKTDNWSYRDTTKIDGGEVETGTLGAQHIVVGGGAVSTNNLVAGKSLTGSGSGMVATDGRKNIGSTYQSFGNGSKNNSASEGSYVQVDLGSIYKIAQSKIYWFSGDNRYYYYKIKYSQDGSKWHYAVGAPENNGWVTSVPKTAGGSIQNPTVDTFAFGITARYVRIYGNGNSVNGGNHIYEWEMFSTPQTRIRGDLIETGTISASHITSGTLSARTGPTKFDLDKGTFNVGNKLTYDGSSLVLNVDTLQIKGSTAATQNQAQQYANTAIDNLEVGGRNLLRNSNFSQGTSTWSINGNASLQKPDGRDAMLLRSGSGGFYAQPQNLEVGVKYTISFLAKSNSSSTNSAVYFGFLNQAASRSTTKTVGPSWEKVEYTTAANLGSGGSLFHFYGAGNTGTHGILITDIKLEKGIKATDWTPAPEDVYDGLKSNGKVTIHGGNITANTLSADRITGRIPGGKITLDGNVTVNGTFKVNDTNLNSGIQANKITTGSMHGNRITANTLNGNRVVARSITADRIATGSITADEIKAGSLTADDITAGTLKSQNDRTEFRLNDGVLVTTSPNYNYPGYHEETSLKTTVGNGMFTSESQFIFTGAWSPKARTRISGTGVYIDWDNTASESTNLTKGLLEFRGQNGYSAIRGDGGRLDLTGNAYFQNRAYFDNGMNLYGTMQGNVETYKNSGKTYSSINATNNSSNRWNSPTNSSLKLRNNNNALSFIVGGTQNNRHSIIQGGHNDAGFASYLSGLHLNRLGGTVYVGSGLSVSGSKNAIHVTRDGLRATPAYEMAESYLGDMGEDKTGLNNKVKIMIDTLFFDTINTDYTYHVFLQAHSNNNVWVEEREKEYFVIASDSPEVSFSWEMKAKRRGFEKDRLVRDDEITYEDMQTMQEYTGVPDEDEEVKV